MVVDDRNIYERIEAAKANFPAIVKGATGQVGTRHYKYADITSVVDGVEPALTAQGVGIFPTVTSGCVVTRLCILASDTGVADSLVCTIPLPADLTPQQVGSAITYSRRYELVLLLNLLTEDDDGEVASAPATIPDREVAPEAQADAPARDLPVPDGWDSREQALAAHRALAARVTALNGTLDTTTFRSNHIFPYSTTDYAELEGIVAVAENLVK